ncbi:ABC transporter ATP-binding protein [Oceaniglobus trochenteri]|uniref:ABC transporter ATP-binding protein n=1 Tax=Oceaniglobus trochenteri TaxID=2763260 RepID=UPI001CFFD869|nr:ATP-binding cassette domain-containing protein [Oceaniglobus trochenteri]
MSEPMVTLEGVGKTFASRALVRTRSFALSDVDMVVNKGEIVGILGESGSGKSTVANIITRLLKHDAGTYRFKGRDVTGYSKAELMAFKSDVQIVFQDPYGSLNPRATIRNIVRESLIIHRPDLTRAQQDDRVSELMFEVGLGGQDIDRYPHEFSGGQRQRIAIARAMAVEPELLVCDEPLSSLDVSIQAQVLELFTRLIRDHDLTMVFITHDLNVARLLCDRVYVMFQGRVVESGAAREVLNNPQQEYTASLLEAVY